MKISIAKSFAVMVLGSSLVGCTRNADAKTYPVTGPALLRGALLADTVVTLMPENVRHSSAIIGCTGTIQAFDVHPGQTARK